jgi:GNAT superfamily N-acetyltransferase
MVSINPVQSGFEMVEENLRAALAVFSVAKENGETRMMPGVQIISSGLAFPMFNAAFHLAAPEGAADDLDRRIAQAQVHFGARGLRWCYWLCEDRLEKQVLRRAREIFGKHGMHLAMASPGMVAGQLPPPERELDALECRRVDDPASRLAFGHIMAVAFGIPFGVATEIYGGENIWRTGFTGYIGYKNGDPVTTTAVMIAAGVIGIYAVGTLPGYQRLGYAETIMRYAIERAREESALERIALQSSQAGLPLYLKLGFRKVTEFQVFVSAA